MANWAILVVTGLRCLLRFWYLCRGIPFRGITAQRALIIAPHPDDETFGCGGLILLKRASGVPVRVVIVTDGEAVRSGLGEPPGSVGAARRREALNACQRLGVDAGSVGWLQLPDSRLPHPGQPGFDRAARALLSEIEVFAPGEIYCPHLLDVRADHIAATRLTHEALRLWSRPCAVFYYPVWMWYHASSGLRKILNTADAWRLDITGVLSNKKHALAAYLDARRKHPKAILTVAVCRGRFYGISAEGTKCISRPRLAVMPRRKCALETTCSRPNGSASQSCFCQSCRRRLRLRAEHVDAIARTAF